MHVEAKKPHLRDYFIAVFLLVLLFWAPLAYHTDFKLPRSEVSIGGTTIAVELAENSSELQKGLSGRSALPEGEGMLLVFDEPDRYGIWMPDMHFPIDVVWIGADRRIVHITEGIVPESYPTIFQPDLPATSILELPAGTVARYGWRAGDEVTLTRSTD